MEDIEYFELDDAADDVDEEEIWYSFSICCRLETKPEALKSKAAIIAAHSFTLNVDNAPGHWFHYHRRDCQPT